MAYYLYEKETGKKVTVDHLIDALEILAKGRYSKVDPNAPKPEPAEPVVAPQPSPPAGIPLEMDTAGIEKAPDPVEQPDKPQEMRPEDKISFKDTRSIGQPKKNR